MTQVVIPEGSPLVEDVAVVAPPAPETADLTCHVLISKKAPVKAIEKFLGKGESFV